MVEPSITFYSKIPWSAHHGGTVISNDYFNGRIFLETGGRVKTVRYLGISHGNKKPILLSDLVSAATTPRLMCVGQIISLVMTRLGDPTTVQTVDEEHIVRSILWDIVIKNGLTSAWLCMEKNRILSLGENYSTEQLKLIYPMVVDDLSMEEYNVIRLALPMEDLLSWVPDYIAEHSTTCGH